MRSRADVVLGRVARASLAVVCLAAALAATPARAQSASAPQAVRQRADVAAIEAAASAVRADIDLGGVRTMRTWRFKKHGCAACHANDKKVVGPAYVDVAAKYKGDASAPAKLMEKVKKGGQGVWGPVPMPPNPSVPDADLKTIVTYVLGLKK